MEKKWENYLVLIKTNLKLVILNNLSLAITFLFLLSFVLGVVNLDQVSSAICLENFVPIIGIILLVPIFAPEEIKEIDEIIKSKSMPEIKIYGIRIILSLFSILLLVSAFACMLKNNNCEFPLVKYTLGSYMTAVFLGSIGLFFSSISGSTIFGYMISISYLILNMMTKNKYLGNFYIFSMKHGSFYEKYWLLGGSIVLIIIAIIIKASRSIQN